MEKRENEEQIPVVLVDDETQILLSYGLVLKSSGIKDIVSIEDSRELLPFLKENKASLVVLDLTMPFVSGLELLPEIREHHPEIPVIIVTATSDIETAIECMQMGAVDYLVKPVEKNKLISSVKNVLEINRLKNEVSSLKNYLISDDLKNPDSFKKIISINKKMIGIFKYIEAIAYSPFPVLITGDTGTGKELIAEAIHLSNPNSKLFVRVNVAGLDDTMFSDTLFGHKKGAFTGADIYRDGLILKAENGTVLLDEISDLSIPSQVKLLRLIQAREYYQLGSDIPRKTNARVIVTANKPLNDLIANGTFRKDLYFRLSAHQIHIPPLRERKEDLVPLTEHFINEAATSMRKKVPSYPPELITLLSSYSFPGNIRELQAMVYDAVSRHESGILSLENFKNAIESGRENLTMIDEGSKDEDESIPIFFSGFPTIKKAEDFLIKKALEKSNGNQGIAASLLGLTRQALNKRLIRGKKGK